MRNTVDSCAGVNPSLKNSLGMTLATENSIDFNEQFLRALELLEKRSRNVFITGRAGTGKSTLLNHFRKTTQKQLVVLAPTGVAAVNIQGETLHSFFGFLPGITLAEATKIAKSAHHDPLYTKIDVIVIDEISMVRADLLDCVDLFLKIVRQNQESFGGVQMAFFGDLYQLPPVVTYREKDAFKKVYTSPYFFDSTVMQSLTDNDHTSSFEFIELEKIYRQHEDTFIALLNGIRNKTITDEQMLKLNEQHRDVLHQTPKEFVFLTATNQQADELNAQNLTQLRSPIFTFNGILEGEYDPKQLPTDIDLRLRKGARVMLLNNDSQGRWINGTLGTVSQVSKHELFVQIDDGPLVEVEPFTWTMYHARYNATSKAIENDEVGRFTQFPVRLAWAMTIHKSQGKTFDKVVIDIGKGTFSHGQIYVALSRCRTFEGIVLKTPIEKKHIWMDFRVAQFLTKVQYRISEKKFPLEKKFEWLQNAIDEKRKIIVTYLKAKDEKSTRTLLPLRLGEIEHEGYRFIGLEAYCFTRQANRVFRVERILAMSDA